jgi:hypothetical protein
VGSILTIDDNKSINVTYTRRNKRVSCISFFWRTGGGQRPLVPLPLLNYPFFSDRLIFFVHHPVNRDDQHLLARAVASSKIESRQRPIFNNMVCPQG